jgi:hypothetical protein
MLTVLGSASRYQFFDWVKARVGVTIVPRGFLDPEELVLIDGKPQWYGKGEWVTTLDLDGWACDEFVEAFSS